MILIFLNINYNSIKLKSLSFEYRSYCAVVFNFSYGWASSLVTKYFAESEIEWKFIPQSAPWMGGAYERLVGVTKTSQWAHCENWKTDLSTYSRFLKLSHKLRRSCFHLINILPNPLVQYIPNIPTHITTHLEECDDLYLGDEEEYYVDQKHTYGKNSR